MKLNLAAWPPCPRCAPRCMECENFTTRHGCGQCDSGKSSFKQYGQPRYRFCPDCGRPMCDEAWERIKDASKKLLVAIPTCALVRELEMREGVETHTAEPYQDVTVSVNGPAVVLAIID